MASLLVITVGVIYWVAMWGILTHLVDYMTGGNVVKEIVVYLGMLALVYVVYKGNPDLLNYV